MRKHKHVMVFLFLLFFNLKIAYANTQFYSQGQNLESVVNMVKDQTKESTPTNKISNITPIIKAIGDQIYCPQTSIKIATDISIIDPDDTSIDSVFIQISTGYNVAQDLLSLSGSHPTIVSNWNQNIGMFVLSSSTPGSQVPYIDFINAIKDVEYTNSSLKPTGNRTFSISLDKLGYLPSNKHFYEFVTAPDIPWETAKKEAEVRTYFGIKGYLVTILSAEEQQLAGEQLPGQGWIGGSDVELEGLWKWMTGPEKGLAFFSNLESTPVAGFYLSKPRSTGSNLIYANWNRTSKYWYEGIGIYEPNNLTDSDGFDEDYAHITVPGIGIKGTWNDLNILGSGKAPHKPQGYIVEYGGMPDDPILEIATSTSLTIPQITETTEDSRCGTGSVTLGAKSNLGIVQWFEQENGGVVIGTGESFITPAIANTTVYYVETKYPICTKSATRTPVTATILNIPVVTTPNSKFSLCGEGFITLTAATSEGTLYWYSEPTGNSLIAVGTSLTRSFNKNTTLFIEAVNDYCTTGTRIPVEVVVYDLPIFQDQEIIKCKGEKVTLASTLVGVNYLWSNGEKTPTIDVIKPDSYSVEVTRPAPESCILLQNILVVEHPEPIIKNIIVDENTVTIKLQNPANYFEYSIDGIHFQTSNIFPNAPSGLQTATVRDTKSCVSVTQTFIVIIIPKFFTPNNDGFNDLWQVKGIINYPEAQVSIFDRYGKLLKQLNANSSGWNGTFNGAELPADDYWYFFKIDKTSTQKSGHFALKR